MIMKLVFSLALSLVLVITASSAILFTDTPSPVLAQDDHGDDDGGDDGGHDDGGGDDDGHDDGGHDDGGHDDGGHDGDDSGQHEWVAEDVRNLWEIENPEGQELGRVQNLRDINGDIIVTPDGVPLLGRKIYDKITGEPIRTYDNRREGEDIYITNTGRTTIPWNYFFELAPGFKSGPGYERYKYTPPPGFEGSFSDDQTGETPSPVPTPENQDGQSGDSPSPVPTPEPEATDQPYQAPPQVPVPEPRDGYYNLAPGERLLNDSERQFGEPQPVIDPTGNPRVTEDGTPVLGQAVLDEEGEPVIGPNGKPIIVIPD